MVGLRRKWAKDYWNWLDLALVLIWFVDRVLGSSSIPISPMILRLFRLVRLLRLLKLVKHFEVFDSLRIMCTAIVGSLSVLLWAVILLSLVQMVIACSVQTLLEAYLLDSGEPEEKRRKVFGFYG